ncbi:unnamed protein product [Rhizophagus irregularis]|nr:unnamed protein product [Rhizophagus irregularis]
MFQLPADCLNEIFEHLENEKFTLQSCMLVNRYWCGVSVRIFWRNVRNYNTSNFSTLIACLPITSKEILYNNGIVISTPTLKTPAFNYASFCKVLSVNRVYYKIEKLLENQQNISPQSLKNYTPVVAQEIFQMFMKEISSLRNCLKNLTELCCSSDISTEIFYQLSQTCYNIQSLTIGFERTITDGIADLISVQRNLKSFDMMLCHGLRVDEQTNIIFSSLMSKIPNTLIKLNVYGRNNYFSLPFIANLSNLQKLKLSFDNIKYFVNFEKLQYTIFPQLQVLKIPEKYPINLLIKFLENNGKNLKEIYIESIKIWCGVKYFLTEKEALEAFANYSQNTYELILYYQSKELFESPLHPEELESFFIKWTDRKPQKSLSLVVVNYNIYSLNTNDKNIEIINKYIKLGIVKKFKVTDFNDEECDIIS